MSPPFRPPAPAAVTEGTPRTRPDQPHPPRPPGTGEKGGHERAGITTRGRSRGRMGRARISTPPPPPWRKGKGGAVPDHPQRQHTAEEGTPRTFRIIPSASTPRKKGRPGPSGSSPAPAHREGSGRPGRAGSRQHPTPESKKQAGTCPPASCVFLIFVFI